MERHVSSTKGAKKGLENSVLKVNRTEARKVARRRG